MLQKPRRRMTVDVLKGDTRQHDEYLMPSDHLTFLLVEPVHRDGMPSVFRSIDYNSIVRFSPICQMIAVSELNRATRKDFEGEQACVVVRARTYPQHANQARNADWLARKSASGMFPACP